MVVTDDERDRLMAGLRAGTLTRDDASQLEAVLVAEAEQRRGDGKVAALLMAGRVRKAKSELGGQ